MSVRLLLSVLLGVLIAVLGRRRLPTAGVVFPKGKVKEIMVSDPLTVEASAPVADVARRMRDANVGMLAIVDAGRLCGVITDRDLVVRSVAVGADPTAVRVGDIATSDIVCAHPGWTVEKAMRVMAANQVGRLPVVDDRQQLLGVVTLSSLALRSGKAAHTMDAARRVAQRSAKGA
jgi:CBS domain-containing protein